MMMPSMVEGAQRLGNHGPQRHSQGIAEPRHQRDLPLADVLVAAWVAWEGPVARACGDRRSLGHLSVR